MATAPGRSCYFICLPDEECHGNCALDTARVLRTQGVKTDGIRTEPATAPRVQTQLPRHMPSGRGESWQLRSACSPSSGRRVSRQMASGRSLPWHHASRCSCQGTTHPDAAATAYPFRTRSVMASALWMQHVFRTQGVKADGIQMEPATAPRIQMQLSRHNASGRSCHSISLPDDECHGNCALEGARLLDAECQGRWHPDGACHGTTRPDAAVKAIAFGPSCHGTEYRSETFHRIRNLGCKWFLAVLGIVTQSSGIHYI